jgi:aryl-alcohol dehydrogenase-like predicted oxidoreductase
MTPHGSGAKDDLLISSAVHGTSAGGPPPPCPRRPLGSTGLLVSSIGFGSFKIGRNQKTKYPTAYELPSDADVESLLNGLLELGVNYIDTAPAYGVSEERIGRVLGHRRSEYVLATKVGETFSDGVSHYDFSGAAVRASVERSLNHLRTEVLDLLFLHSDGRDLWIQEQTDAVAAMVELKRRGLVQKIGLSGKTVDGARFALEWADVLMVEYHLEDRSHEDLIREADSRGVGVIVKKGLASGHLPADQAIHFVLSNPRVASIVVGGVNLTHFHDNVTVASGHR